MFALSSSYLTSRGTDASRQRKSLKRMSVNPLTHKLKFFLFHSFSHAHYWHLRNGARRPIPALQVAKILYTFHPSAVHTTVSNIPHDIRIRCSWCINRSMRFLADKSSMLVYKYNVPTEILRITRQVIPASQNLEVWVHGVPMNSTSRNSSSVNFQRLESRPAYF